MYVCLISLALWGIYKTLKAIDLLFNSNIFQSFLCNETFISFQLYWLIKHLIFDILSGLFLIFWWVNATVRAYWKHFSSLFSRFIVVFLFFSYSGKSIYDPPLSKLILWRCNKSTLSKTSSLPLIFFSNRSWYLCKRDVKSSLINYSVLFPIMISMSLLFVCIVRISSESLGLKLIIIINWIFHSPWSV